MTLEVVERELRRLAARQARLERRAIGDPRLSPLITSYDLDTAVFPPKCVIAHNATQTILHNTVTAVAFNFEVRDTDSMHSNTVNNSRITATTPGWYLITAVITWPANVTGERAAWVKRNGTEYMTGQWGVTNTIGGRCAQNVSFLMQLDAIQYVEFVVYQTSGISLVLLASNAASTDPLSMAAVWVAP